MKSLATVAICWLAAAAVAATGCGGNGEATVTKVPPPASRDGNGSEPRVGDGRGGVKLTQIGSFDQPVYLTQPPGKKRDLYVVEKGGTIRVIHDGKLEPAPFLDLSDSVSTGTEQGLLSMAFAPDYPRSGLVYLDYTNTDGDSRVVEYRRSRSDPLRADPGSARELLAVDQPYENHNGGLLLFGPDRRLYIGLGDGGSSGDPERRGQDLSTLLAKILRIDPRPKGGKPYGVPSDNPYVGRPGARPETYSYGLRNPWRFSFDRKTDALSIGDVGQNEFEEIDYVGAGQGAGANFGWSAFEGDARFNDDQNAAGAIAPVLTYPLGDGTCAVTGGYVVRDFSLRSLYGRYIYGDFCAGLLRSFVPSPTGAKDDRLLGREVPMLSSFAEDLDGHIYATSLEGPVYRLDPAE
jgi:glucose/arabinose dehydrogenase